MPPRDYSTEIQLPPTPKREHPTHGFRPPPNRRGPERILIYGEEKIGKSFCWIDVAERLYRTEADAVMHVLDTDSTWDAMYDAGYDYLEDSGIVVPYHPVDMDEALDMSMEIYKVARPVQDWVVIDMADWFWDEAQTLYIRNVHGRRPANYFLEMRKEVKEAESRKKGHKAQFGGQEGMDWNFITKVYKDFEELLTEKSRAHKLVVTSAKKLDENRGASPQDIKRYKKVGGMKPAGQKGIGHRSNTLLRMQQRSTGKRQIVMVGDRGRENRQWVEVVGKTTIDIPELDPDEGGMAFAEMYLTQVAGWAEEHQDESSVRPATKARRGTAQQSRSKAAKPTRRASSRTTKSKSSGGSTSRASQKGTRAPSRRSSSGSSGKRRSTSAKGTSRGRQSTRDE